MNKAKDVTYMDKLRDCSEDELAELIAHAAVQYLCKVNANRSRIKADIDILNHVDTNVDIEIDLKLNNLK